MLIDCFPFFNELDMLECRLEYLNDKVDKFVLVEAYTTHMGKPKPLYFDENKERFAKYLDKIIHVKHNITVSKPSYEFDLSKNTDNAAWEADTDQRNAILKGLVGLPDDAIVMISDVDEIPNKEAIDRAIRLLAHKQIVFLETKFFLYNLGQHLKEPWPATSVCRNEIFTVKNTKPQMLRQGKDAYFKVLNGGWHLSYFGDVSRIQTKIQNFTHQEFNTEQFTNPEWIAERIRLGEDLYARPFPTVKVKASSFPDEFLKCFGRYLPEKKLEHYADSVEGWFSAGDMDLYRRVVAQAPATAHFVEVGSYKGRSSSYMAVEIAHSGKNIKFDCVDTWEGSVEHVKGGIFEDPDVVNNRLYEEFLKNMEPVKDYYRPIRTTSVEAAQLYQDQSLDFVFIDAAHDYENVKADILAWAPKVKSGGIIGGHDWHHPPIKQAVGETLGEVNEMGGSWYVFKA